MASESFIETTLARVPSNLRGEIRAAFTEALSQFRFGRCTPGEVTENGQFYAIEGTTPAIADTEFSIRHGLATAPYLLIPILALTTAGQQLVPLEVARPADRQRVYLKSSATNAPFRALVEAVR